jgi:hypothetical protein
MLSLAENLRIQVSKLKESQNMNNNYGSNNNHSNAGGDSSVGNSSSWSPVAPSSSSSNTKVKSESSAQSSSSSTLISPYSNSNHDTKQRKLPSFDSMHQQPNYKLENGSNNDSDSYQDYSNVDMDQNFDRQSSAASSASSSASIQRYNPSKCRIMLRSN